MKYTMKFTLVLALCVSTACVVEADYYDEPPTGEAIAFSDGDPFYSENRLDLEHGPPLGAALVGCVDQVPTLSGSTSLVSTSGVYTSSYPAWKAFDGAMSSMWISEVWETPAWIAYDFGAGKTIHQYTITNTNGSLTSRAPKDFTFEAWTGSSWIVLDARVNQTGWSSGTPRSYAVASPGSYAKYRLRITDDNDSRGGVVVISIGDLRFETCASSDPSDLRVTHNGATVSCVTPGLTYKIEADIGSQVACACAELQGATSSVLLTNECIDGQGDVYWWLQAGSEQQITARVTAGCNPPHPGGSPVVGEKFLTINKCCQPITCSPTMCGLVSNGCGGQIFCGFCDDCDFNGAGESSGQGNLIPVCPQSDD